MDCSEDIGLFDPVGPKPGGGLDRSRHGDPVKIKLYLCFNFFEYK